MCVILCTWLNSDRKQDVHMTVKQSFNLLFPSCWASSSPELHCVSNITKSAFSPLLKERHNHISYHLHSCLASFPLFLKKLYLKSRWGRQSNWLSYEHPKTSFHLTLGLDLVSTLIRMLLFGKIWWSLIIMTFLIHNYIFVLICLTNQHISFITYFKIYFFTFFILF